MCDKNILDTSRNSLLLADRNPLFENICSCCNQSDRTIRIDPQLLAQMSNNHRGRGQNILRRDGSALFMIDRQIAGDDIYTLKGILLYRGSEIPCTDGMDNFWRQPRSFPLFRRSFSASSIASCESANAGICLQFLGFLYLCQVRNFSYRMTNPYHKDIIDGQESGFETEWKQYFFQVEGEST
jgi:hypothetical protein